MTVIHVVAATGSALLAFGSLPAQAVSITVSALTPLSVQVTSGGQTVQNSLPPGVLPPIGNVAAVVQGSVSYASWYTHVDDTKAVAELTNNVFGNSTAVAVSGIAGPHEFLVQFTGTGLPSATLALERASQVTTGVPWPSVDIDFDNDGTIDISNPSSATSWLPAFGTQPCLVRVILTSVLPSNGASSTQVQLTLRPHNNVVISQTAFGCVPPSIVYGFEVTEAFPGSGVALTATAFDPMVLVLGLSQQPFLLPSSALGPCLVVPSPDVLLVAPPFASTIIPLPAAVRPVTFQAQAVGINVSGLLTTNAFSVFAY